VVAVHIKIDLPSKSDILYSVGRYTTEHAEVSGEAVYRYLEFE